VNASDQLERSQVIRNILLYLPKTVSPFNKFPFVFDPFDPLQQFLALSACQYLLYPPNPAQPVTPMNSEPEVIYRCDSCIDQPRLAYCTHIYK
jgi:hypothetical protein